MKSKKLAMAFILTALTCTTIVKAGELSLPVISKPSVLDEGTERELSAAQISELLPWAKDTKVFLVDLMESLNGLTMSEQTERLIEGIKVSVIESAPKNSELLMRYALNRAVVVNQILDKEMDSNAAGFVDAKNRVLMASIKLALKYYDSDIAKLSANKASPFADFGKDYFVFLNELNKSIFDASAQFKIQRIALEWLQNDLYRDVNNTKFAASIVKINNGLKLFQAEPTTDAKSILMIKQMKKLTAQLGIDLKNGAVVFNSGRTGTVTSNQYLIDSPNCRIETANLNYVYVVAGTQVEVIGEGTYYSSEGARVRVLNKPESGYSSIQASVGCEGLLIKSTVR